MNTRIEPPTAAASFVEAALLTADQMGFDVDTLCARRGLSRAYMKEPTNRIAEDVAVALLRDIETMPCCDFGLHMGLAARPGTYSALGYAVMNCATLADAFELIPRYEAIVLESGQTWLEKQHDGLALCWKANLGAPLPRALIDAIFCSWLSLGRWLTHRQLFPTRARVQYAQPQDCTLLHQVYGPHIDFAQDSNALVFADASVLQQPILHADAAVQAMMRAQAQRLKDALVKQNPIADRVRWSLEQGLPAGRFSLHDVAAQFHMSERTLRRRLNEAGIRYHEILAQTRHQLALQYLQDDTLSLLDIALLLGYSEHSAFTAAFRSWTGITPQQHRRLTAPAQIPCHPSAHGLSDSSSPG